MKLVIRLSLLTTIGFCIPSAVLAQGQVPDLRTASIEELLNIEITSASRKEQRAADVAAAVFVITHDDKYFDFADRIIKLDVGKIVGENVPPPTFLAPALAS